MYAVDRAHPAKHKLALRFVDETRCNGTGVLSTQVLIEFYSVAVNKLKITRHEAQGFVEDLKQFEIVPSSVELVDAAINLTMQYSISIFDAMLVAAAALSACDRLVTEDLQHGSTIAGVKIENPFL